MNIADNILKHHLKNVYVITGHACGGKTTASRYLADKYEMILFDWDAQFPTYMELVDSRYQPAMRQRPEFKSWEEYFMWPLAEYAAWLEATFKEQTDMAIAHLLDFQGTQKAKKSWSMLSLPWMF